MNTSNYSRAQASQKTSARPSKKELSMNLQAQMLVDFFRQHKVPDKATMRAFDLLIDLAKLNPDASLLALDHVKTFLRHRLPEPTDNEVVNLTVIAVMGIILEGMEEDDSDDYRKHNNNINSKIKRDNGKDF